MPAPIIRFEGIGKIFRRSRRAGLIYNLTDTCRKLIGKPLPEKLRPDEFWALRDISFELGAGECLGIIGPNGAGKSTLLKLANRELLPDRGSLQRHGRVHSLIRLGSGLQPLLSGRENIYIACGQLGLSKSDTDARLASIAAFAGLEKNLDIPVKHYSDGMYARLEFSIATSVVADVLLIDEVLAVGDIVFQMRCLERIEQLKRAGSCVLFVSHSEMNVRQVADQCLLLFDGEVLAQGDPEQTFLKYYAAAGYLTHKLRPLQSASPDLITRPVKMLAVSVVAPQNSDRIATGTSLTIQVEYAAEHQIIGAALVVEFRNPADTLIASTDSTTSGAAVLLEGQGKLLIRLPFFGLGPGKYRVGAGFRVHGGTWLGYRPNALALVVADARKDQSFDGLAILQSELLPHDR